MSSHQKRRAKGKSGGFRLGGQSAKGKERVSRQRPSIDQHGVSDADKFGYNNHNRNERKNVASCYYSICIQSIQME